MREYLIILSVISANLLLFRSSYLSKGDININKLADFYGLSSTCLDLTDSTTIDTLITTYLSEAGPKGIAVSHRALEYVLSTEDIEVVSAYVHKGGNLLIYEVIDTLPLVHLNLLIDGRLRLVDKVYREEDITYAIAVADSQITREFTGLRFPFSMVNYNFDYGQIYDRLNRGSVVISLGDYAILVRFKAGNGFIFIDSGNQYKDLEENALRDLYRPQNFSVLVPKMFFIRGAFGDYCWHSKVDFANLTIDDPRLVQPWGNIDYFQLLQEMDLHNFHTTIGFIPRFFTTTIDCVASLFINRSDRFSIVQHGNNHDGYEFYFYTQQQVDSMCEANGGLWCDSSTHFPRSLQEQEADILEGLTRMYEHQTRSGVSFGRVMIFPWGIAPTATLGILKKYNYLATINAQTVPLGEELVPYWSYGIHPAEDYFSNFPLLIRRHPCTSYFPFVMDKFNWPFVLFIDRPLLLYSHHNEIFQNGVDGFNPVADYINDSLYGEVKWASLDEILKHLYWEKENNDGSVSVWVWTNDVVITNSSDERKLFHLKKYETENVPISSVSVNGREVSYSILNDTLEIDFYVDGRDSVEFTIDYGNFSCDFAIFNEQVSFIESDTLRFVVHNLGYESGICPYKITSTGTATEDSLLSISVTSEIFPECSTIVKLALMGIANPSIIKISLDPYNIVKELDESNNIVFFNVRSWYNKKLSDAKQNRQEDSYSDLQGSSKVTFNVFPIPAENMLLLEYYLPFDERIAIKLYSVNGRLVQTFKSGFEMKGVHRLILDKRTLDTGFLPEGIYFTVLRLEGEGKVLSRKIVWLNK